MQKKREELLKVARFVIVGAVNTAVYYLLYALFLYITGIYWLAVLIASALGTGFSFYSFGRYAFRKRGDKIALVKFYLLYAFNTLLNIFFVWVFMLLGTGAYIAGALASIAVAGFSYIVNRFYIFK